MTSKGPLYGGDASTRVNSDTRAYSACLRLHDSAGILGIQSKPWPINPRIARMIDRRKRRRINAALVALIALALIVDRARG